MVAERVTSGSRNEPLDPELQALHEAELVLFPRPLDGASPGWSWDVPTARISRAETGLPPSTTTKVASSSELSERDAQWLRRLVLPNVPVRLDARVVKYLKFYRDSEKGRQIAEVWTKKSGKYTAALKAAFVRAGLPSDLVWLSLVESGHNPDITSPAGAAGLWQFIPETARLYGLTVDRWVDERLDPERATQAAARFLADLHQRFGNWELAMAAYNMGYGGLLRAIRKYNTNDFWELSRHEAGVPWETALYVPKIYAIAIVMNNRQAFGLDRIQPEEPISFDTVVVQPGVSLSRVGAAAEVSLPEIEALNLHFLAARVPPTAPKPAPSGSRPGTPEKNGGRWRVRVPKGTGSRASQKLAQSGDLGAALRPYLVRFGDTVASISQDLGVPAARLGKDNAIGASERLEQGTVLLVPAEKSRPEPAAEPVVVVVPAHQFSYSDRRRVFYEAQAGDTLEQIADFFGVPVADLEMWNVVDTRAALQAGMTLQIFVPRSADLGRVRCYEEGKVRILTAATPEFFDHFEGLNGKKRIVVAAKQGDTLTDIGKRYGVTPASMERVNRRPRNDVLASGESVVVYVPKGAAASSADQGFTPLPEVSPPYPDALP